VEDFDILIAYDDPHLLKAVSSGFEGRGYRVFLAGSEEEAVELLDRRPFDAVITSVVLDPQQRDAVLKTAKKANRDAVIVMLGNRKDPKCDHDTLSFRGHDFISSPSGKPTLWKHVDLCLERVMLGKKDAHAKRLIEKFKEQISDIADTVSKNLGEELLQVAREITLLRDGQYGEMDRRAVDRLDGLLETVRGLAREAELLSRGFIPGERSGKPFPGNPGHAREE